jgi:hypothetical protein
MNSFFFLACLGVFDLQENGNVILLGNKLSYEKTQPVPHMAEAMSIAFHKQYVVRSGGSLGVDILIVMFLRIFLAKDEQEVVR